MTSLTNRVKWNLISQEGFSHLVEKEIHTWRTHNILIYINEHYPGSQHPAGYTTMPLRLSLLLGVSEDQVPEATRIHQ